MLLSVLLQATAAAVGVSKLGVFRICFLSELHLLLTFSDRESKEQV